MDLPEIPFNKDITYLGLATYRDKNKPFGIKRQDRRQHVYILGKSGSGKSVLMYNMILQNIMNGEGVGVVEPHDTYAPLSITTRPARARSVPSFLAAVLMWITHGSRVGLAMNSSIRSKTIFTGRRTWRARRAAITSIG